MTSPLCVVFISIIRINFVNKMGTSNAVMGLILFFGAIVSGVIMMELSSTCTQLQRQLHDREVYIARLEGKSVPVRNYLREGTSISFPRDGEECATIFVNHRELASVVFDDLLLSVTSVVDLPCQCIGTTEVSKDDKRYGGRDKVCAAVRCCPAKTPVTIIEATH